MNRNVILIGLMLTIFSTSAHAWIWGLLARGTITRGVVGAAERNVVAEAAYGSSRIIGQASRSAVGNGNMSWLGREATKEAIRQALRGQGSIEQDLSVTNCLLIEFDGRGNYLANYCNESISIGAFAQQDAASGSVIRVGCQDCVVQPGQLAYYAPFSATGPFLAAEFKTSDTRQEPAYSVRQENIAAENSASGVEAKAIRWTKSEREATLIMEVTNPSPISIGLVVATRSIFNFAEARIFTQCGGVYEQAASPYDSFSGISKDPKHPTWIPSGGKITVMMRPNNLRNGVGGTCNLTHATIDAYAFRQGVPNGQSMPIVVIIQ